MKENIDKLFGIVDEMLDKADPKERSRNERLELLAGGNIPAITVSEWAVRLSKLAQEMSCNTK